MTKVVTIKEHRYSGKLRKPDDEYELEGQSYLALFKALRWVIDQVIPAKETIQAPIPSIVQVVEEVVLEAEARNETLVSDEQTHSPEQESEAPDESSSIVSEGSLLEVKPKRAYKRRDMNAEE